MEGYGKNVSNFRCAIQVSYVVARQWLEILINRFLIKKLSVGGGEWWWEVVDIFWLVVCGGGWWWIYFGLWWVVVDGGGYILASGGWWRMVVDVGESWWVVA